MTGPERRARAIARGNPHVSARRLAKRAGIRVEAAREILEDERRRRRREA